MAALSDPQLVLAGLALVSLGYAALGGLLLATDRVWPSPRRRAIGRYFAVTSPLPVALFGLLAGLVAVSPPVLRLVLWLVVLVGAWGAILLSPAIAVAFLLDRDGTNAR